MIDPMVPRTHFWANHVTANIRSSRQLCPIRRNHTAPEVCGLRPAQPADVEKTQDKPSTLRLVFLMLIRACLGYGGSDGLFRGYLSDRCLLAG